MLATKKHLFTRWVECLTKLKVASDRWQLQPPKDESEILQWADANGVPYEDVYQPLAEVAGLRWEPVLSGKLPSADFVTKYPIALARSQNIIGFEQEGNTMTVAIGSLDSINQIDIVGRFFNCQVEPFVAAPSQIQTAINVAYQNRSSQTDDTIGELDVNDVFDLEQWNQREDLLNTSGRSPVIKLVNSIFFDAAQSRASDIHIQPCEEELRVRFRIDGVLFDQFKIPKSSQEEVLSRIKVIGSMDIAEKRLPQDGRSSVQIGDRLIDLRIASIPSSFGERIVIRLLDKSARMYSLEDLGMPDSILESFQKLIKLEHGLILVTGPTGGGKSTTLYAGLQEINTNYRNVITLEDPIEYQLSGISQTQISDKKGMTFASGLRSVLRQDPDIIMVGEIRDQETAEMAIQSALTGHMVFSTLHTNDAPSAVNRILDLKIEPYLVASSLIGVLAQRLVRCICQHCKVKDSVTLDQLKQLGPIPDEELAVAYRGTGCSECRNTGYNGRIGLFELMLVDEEIRRLIQNRQNASAVREAARKNGMRVLGESGLEKILLGQTTFEEVIRVSSQPE